jgi:membrane associated rhomboid family serine protease
MNGLMLMAFGSGVERGVGAKNMIFIFIFSGLCGIGLQYALNPASIHPVIGASGGISGLFAAAFVLISRTQKKMGGSTSNIWKFIALWIGISVIFGFLGSPDGNAVAWMAHLGGFFGGFAALKLLKLI